MTISDYLRVGRAQTAAVEGAGFPLAAWIGGAPLWSLPVFALLGLLAHLGGFGENSLTDIAYDRQDPSKADHPLVAGRVSASGAGAFIVACQLVGIILFTVVFATRGHVALLPVGAFLGYILLGHAYNVLGKRWKVGAVLEISGAFALAFLAMGSVWTGGANALIWTVTAYAFFFTAFQIAIAGELKELAQPGEKNVLRRLGARVGPGALGAVSPTLGAILESAKSSGSATVVGETEPFLFPGARAFTLGLGLSLAKTIALGFVAYFAIGAVWGLAWANIVGMIGGTLFMVYSMVLLSFGPFNRPRRLRIMGIGEAGSYLLLVFALVPALWPWLLAAFIVLPVLWFAGMNRLLWSRTGSAWAPGV